MKTTKTRTPSASFFVFSVLKSEKRYLPVSIKGYLSSLSFYSIHLSLSRSFIMLLLNFTHLAVAVLAFFVSKQDTTRQLLLGKGRRGNAQQQQQKQLGASSPKEESSTTAEHPSVAPESSAAVLASTSTDASSSESTSSILRTTASLQLPAADAIAQGAIHAAQTAFQAIQPITVTVLDAHGHVLVQKRMDACPPGVYPQLSCAKAKTCIHLQTSSRQFRQKYLVQTTATTTTHNQDENDPSSMLSLSPQPAQFTQAATMVSAVGHGELIPIAGGILIVDNETGQIVGAVGVSGAAADEDEYCALAGVEAVNALTRATATTSRSNDPHPALLRTIPAQHSCQTVVSARPTATVVM